MKIKLAKLSSKYLYAFFYLSCVHFSAFAEAKDVTDNKTCKLTKGHYATSLLENIANGIQVPESSVKYEGTFIGSMNGLYEICLALVSTPNGPHTFVVSVYTTDKGKSFFVGPTLKGLAINEAECKKS